MPYTAHAHNTSITEAKKPTILESRSEINVTLQKAIDKNITDNGETFDQDKELVMLENKSEINVTLQKAIDKNITDNDEAFDQDKELAMLENKPEINVTLTKEIDKNITDNGETFDQDKELASSLKLSQSLNNMDLQFFESKYESHLDAQNIHGEISYHNNDPL